MLQARGLAEVATACRALGLSVMVFTGYTLEYLKAGPMPGVLELLQSTDLLVDGPYIAAQLETRRNWAGSMNQRFHFLSDRYHPGIEFDPSYPHGFELRISGDGTLRTNGWPVASKAAPPC
jgi:anaerobic ribonucleoside-triphosphate reductase activating protein